MNFLLKNTDKPLRDCSEQQTAHPSKSVICEAMLLLMCQPCLLLKAKAVEFHSASLIPSQ